MTMCITTSSCAAYCPSALFFRDGYLHSQQESRARRVLLVSYRPLGLKNARRGRPAEQCARILIRPSALRSYKF